jgi:cbb3-type cytochrome oxidase subunit 3
MFAELFSKSPLLVYPIIALVIFIVVFAGIAVRAMRQRPEERDEQARLPLADDLEVGHGR